MASLERRRLSPNLGSIDRQTRFAIGALMIAAPMLANLETLGAWSILILAAIPIITTAIIGWDPFYALANKTSLNGKAEHIQQRSWSYANVGLVDRSMRLGVGMAMLYSLLTMDAMTADIALTLMAIPLITTAIMAWDPLYAALDINSFGSRMDVKAAEPEVEDSTLESFFILPPDQPEPKLAKAA